MSQVNQVSQEDQEALREVRLTINSHLILEGPTYVVFVLMTDIATVLLIVSTYTDGHGVSGLPGPPGPPGPPGKPN